MTLFDLIVDGAIALGSGVAGALVVGLRRLPRPERTCTGYERGTSQQHDCKAVRSPFCRDGRCGLHCKACCKCEESST